MRLPLFTVLLAALNVALAWTIGVQLFGAPRLDDEVKAALQQHRTPLPPELPAAAAPPSFGALQSQAVFHKSRSFYVAPPSPVDQQPPPDYRMVGLMALPNRPASAVLLNNQLNVRVRVAVGDQIEGWEVVDVSAKRVVLHLGERTSEITSATRAANAGMTIGPGAQASAGASSGMVRVSGAPTGASPTAAPARTSPPVDAAVRLYRPPSQ